MIKGSKKKKLERDNIFVYRRPDAARVPLEYHDSATKVLTTTAARVPQQYRESAIRPLEVKTVNSDHLEVWL